MKNSMVVYPNADKQEIRAAAQAAYTKWLERSRATCENKKRNCLKVDNNKLSNINKAKMKKAALASMAIQVHHDVYTTPSKDDSGTTCIKKP
jgi:hypothetical protein